MAEQRRTYLARFLAFMGILICLFLLLNYNPKQERANFRPHWGYFYKELPEDSIDIVFLGNSHSHRTFIPEIIDTLLGTKSINLGTPGEAIYQTKYEYQEVLRYQDPAVVVIESYVILGGSNRPDTKPFLFSFFDSMPFSLRKIQYLHALFSPGDLIKYLFPFTAKHTDWKTPYVPINKAMKKSGRETSEIVLENQGYLPLYGPLHPGKIQKREVEKPGDCPIPDLHKRLAATEDVLRINESDLSTLLFIEAPTISNFCECCKNPTYELLDSYGVPHFKLFENIDPSSLWFHDSGHMSQFGAVIATIDTARILSDELGIEMNTDALEYFMSYRFRDYVHTRDGDTIHIKLMPFDQEASKELTYLWEVYSDGERIFKNKNQSGSEFTFTIPDAQEEYLIMVRINNPAGDYELVGEFSINKDNLSEITEE